jgi:membrane-anchored mycosin MYCP
VTRLPAVAAVIGSAVLGAALLGPPAAAPRLVTHQWPVAVAPQPPAPPPLRAGPPAGRRPGPAPGLEAMGPCAPPAADGAPAATAPAELRLAEAHRLATGRGQVVAVIDTGVAPHPLLAGRLTGGGDYLTGGDGLDDCDGHGTAVAGLLAAAPEPRERAAEPVGIAPGARLLAIRQSSPSYSVPGPDATPRPAGDTDTLAEAVVLAVRAGADVVNISEAVCLPPERAAVAGAPLQAALRYAADADVVVVAAAGNVGSGSCTGDAAGQVSLPGWYDDHVLAVGAVEPGDAPAPFTVPGPWVDVAAPGTGLRSLAVGGGTTADGVTGTSFAAPWAAGLAALVRERFPELTARQVVDRILATARRAPDGRGALGHGVVDPIAALTAVPARLEPVAAPAAPAAVAALPGTTPQPPPPPEEDPPLDLLAAAVLLAAAILTAVLLRRRPRRH